MNETLLKTRRRSGPGGVRAAGPERTQSKRPKVVAKADPTSRSDETAVPPRDHQQRKLPAASEYTESNSGYREEINQQIRNRVSDNSGFVENEKPGYDRNAPASRP